MTILHGIVLVLIGLLFFLGRSISDRAVSRLSNEDKGRAFELAAPISRIASTIIVAFILVGIGIDRSGSSIPNLGGWIACFGYMLSFGISSYVTRRRLELAQFPSMFLKDFVVSRALSGIGIMAFWCLVLVMY